jgi:hypothetical protein
MPPLGHSNRVQLLTPANLSDSFFAASGVLASLTPVGENFVERDWHRLILGNFLSGLRKATLSEAISFRVAAEFVTQELKGVSIRYFPIAVGPFHHDFNLRNGSSNYRGLAYPSNRGFVVREGVTEKDLIIGTGVAVHEYTHLNAKTRIAKDWISAGFTFKSDKDVLFSLLREHTAVSMQSRYLRSQGLTEQVQNVKYTVTPTTNSNHNFLLAAMYAEIYDTEGYYSHCSKNGIDIKKFQAGEQYSLAWVLQSRLRSLSPFVVTLPRLVWRGASTYDISGYATAFQSMRCLNYEVMPVAQTKSDARQSFEDLMFRWHHLGDTQAACRFLRRQLGDSILKVVAYLKPKLINDTDETSLEIRDNLLLRMYVDAASLEPRRRKFVRQGISQLAKNRDQLSLNCTTFTTS